MGICEDTHTPPAPASASRRVPHYVRPASRHPHSEHPTSGIVHPPCQTLSTLARLRERSSASQLSRGGSSLSIL